MNAAEKKAEKVKRGTSLDNQPKTHHHQAASITKAEDPVNRTMYGRSALERSFRTGGKGDRAISALDAKLNAMQNLIYGASGMNNKKIRISIKK